MFTVENLAVRLGDKNILQNVHFTIDTPGQLVGTLPRLPPRLYNKVDTCRMACIPYQ